LFRIFQESLTNVSRHANANKVNVTLKQKGQQLILSIEDNGRGFEKDHIAAKDTLGILGMKERSQMMGGNYEISSIPGKGTTVIVAVPYNLKSNLK
jgi:signal transduction histidine kinase